MTQPVFQYGPMPSAPPVRPARGAVVAVAVGLVVLAALIGVAAWQGVALFTEKRSATVQAASEDTDRIAAMKAANEAAVNLTSVGWQTIDGDVKRIVDNSTGTFHDEFVGKADQFAKTVRDAKSTSVGKLSASGVEAVNGDKATVLVAISVKTSTADAPDQQPRSWRLRIGVQRVDGRYLPSNVEFVQ